MLSVCRGRVGLCFEAAAKVPVARRFLVWARYPAIEVETAPSGGTLVRFADVRYRAADRLSGPVVELPAELRSATTNSRYSSSSLRRGMSSTRSVHWISGHTCTRDLNFQPPGVFSNVSS